MATPCSPVDTFDQGVMRFRAVVRERLPFTFIAYRSLIPEKEDDWYYLAQKVAWFVFIVFNFVSFLENTVSPFFWVLPFVPMLLDAVWITARYFHLLDFKSLERSAHVIQVVGFSVFSLLGVAIVYSKVRPSS